VQNENSLYEIPPHRLHVDYEGKRLGEGRELGEARVVSTIFGRAKVHVIRKQDHSGWLWLLVILTALGSMAAFSFWMRDAAPDTPEADSIAVTPLKPPIPPEIPVPTQQNSIPPHLESLVPVLPAPSPATAKNITVQLAMPRSAIQQPEKSKSTESIAVQNPAVANKPNTLPPVAAHQNQPGTQAGIARPTQSPTAVPLPIKPVVTEPALQITKTPPTRAAEPTSAVIGKTAPSVSGNQQSDQTGVQPQGAAE